MSDIRPGDSEALPWLEAVEDEDEAPAVSARKMLAALLMVLVGVGIVAATLFWLGRQDSGTGPPILIRAEPGPYKVRPQDPGGLDVTGDSGTAYATGAGEDNDALLDVSRLDDSPTPPPVEQPPAAAAKPPPTAPKPPPAPSGAKGTVVQLGAYGSTAKAETAWKLLSGRFPEVAGLSKIIVPYSG
ncbi:MAG TPA: hypothetical protein VM326_03480, partial [Sphingomicrobium sp.]|nr:hypothetical protein [Sphingomicrobium sp.]